MWVHGSQKRGSIGISISVGIGIGISIGIRSSIGIGIGVRSRSSVKGSDDLGGVAWSVWRVSAVE